MQDLHESPAAIALWIVGRPVSGLTSDALASYRSPSRAVRRSGMMTGYLVYRCGGSDGIALRRTVFPFNA